MSRKFRTILVPLDGSPFAERALPYAQAIAQASGAHLTLIQAAEAHTFPDVDAAAAQMRAVSDAEAYLAAVAERLVCAGVTAGTAVYYGSATEAIVDEVGIRNADLVVMATHGRTGPGRAILGSVADQVTRHAQAPVLLVGTGCDRRWPRDQALRVLLPLDGSDLAEEAVKLAHRLATTFDSTGGIDLTLVRIVDSSSVPVYPNALRKMIFDHEAEMHCAQAYLQAEEDELRHIARDITVIVGTGPAAARINDIASECRADVIVMATHGLGGLARLALGSVAANTLHKASVPVLVARPRALREPVDAPQLERAGSAGHIRPTSTVAVC